MATSYGHIWDKSFPDERTANLKFPESGIHLTGLNGQEASVPGAERREGRKLHQRDMGAEPYMWLL